MKKFFKFLKIILFQALLINEITYSQIFENFDSNILKNWQFCNQDHWEIDTINNILYHNFDNDSDSYELLSYTHNKLILDSSDTEWSFKIYYPINSSSNNKWNFLISINSIVCDEKFYENLNGYVFGINFTGDDNNLKFWKVNNGYKTLIKDLNVNWNTGNFKNSPAIFSLKRNINGLWWIYLDTLFNQNSKILLDSFYEKSFSEFFSTGFYYKYTKTRDKNFYLYFLQINGKFIKDTIPPEFKNYEIFEKSLRLIYDEPLSKIYFTNINILISNVSDIMVNNTIVTDNYIDIFFNKNLPDNLLLTMEVKYISDLFYNFSSDTITIENFEIKPNDIIITEIMADPSPTIKLPECEYIELYNRSNKIITLNKYILKISNKKYYIPDSIIFPEEYVILTNENCSYLFKPYGKVITISNMTSINNEGCEIALFDKNEKLITYVFFDNNFYNDPTKKSGGWSIEIINTNMPCEGRKNWTASIDPSGGTPGKVNSVNNMITLENKIPELNKIFIYNDSTIWLIFNKVISKIDTIKRNYNIKNFDTANTVKIYNEISNILELTFNKKFENKKTYTFVMNTSVEDCSGNYSIYPVEVNFQKSEPVTKGDIIFSEILFSPYEFDGEFFEIYNNSSKYIDLSNCLIGIDYTNNTKKYFKPINYPYPIIPNEYIVLTKNSDKIKKYYKFSENNIIETDKIPMLPDDGRCIYIYNKDTTEIDKFCYNKNLYPELINNFKGISLEKNINCNSNKNKQWNCASFLIGATPGMQNSQECSNEIENDKIEIEKDIFSPDGDGIDDEIIFKLIFKNPENICNTYIFNSSGILMNVLLKNQLMGIDNEIKWDGKTMNGVLAPIGIYIIFIEYYNKNGEVKQLKKSFYLARKIN